MFFNIFFGFIGLMFFGWIALAMHTGFQSTSKLDKDVKKWHEQNPDANILRGHGGRGY